jgi:hypothetical protein
MFIRVRRIVSLPKRAFFALAGRLARIPFVKKGLKKIYYFLQLIASLLLYPLNLFLALTRKNIKHENSVLHISYMIHIPYYTTRLLRSHGMKADYLAMGDAGSVWNQADYNFIPKKNPFTNLLQEIYIFWKIVAKYEIIHSHFAMMLTQTGWEYPFLKIMGRKIVTHYRGCEVRNREENMRLHPKGNICEQCDYQATICRDPVRRQRVRLSKRFADTQLVTTPDMLDFVPEAQYFPFFLPQPEKAALSKKRESNGRMFKLVHVTGHPGIEGTAMIQEAVERLKKKGYEIDFVFLHLVDHHRVLREMASADLTIGKMKMGFYANAQIESMFLGVPAMTYVRPGFITPELENSGFIFTTLDNLEETLQYYLDHPEALAAKKRIARSSVIRLHDNEKLAKRLIKIYREKKVTV